MGLVHLWTHLAIRAKGLFLGWIGTTLIAVDKIPKQGRVSLVRGEPVMAELGSHYLTTLKQLLIDNRAMFAIQPFQGCRPKQDTVGGVRGLLVANFPNVGSFLEQTLY
jgi:hypothetical protein